MEEQNIDFRNMRIPKVNLRNAIKAYYSIQELGNEDIRWVFEGSKIGGTLIQTMKRAAREKTIEMKKPVFSAYRVNTECAFLAWGLDIAELEKNYNKLKKLGLLDEPVTVITEAPVKVAEAPIMATEAIS